MKDLFPTPEETKTKVALCGGGTGGHIFPSIAVAQILQKEGCDLYYIGVSGKLEEKIAEENNIDFYGYEFTGFPRKFETKLLTWPLSLFKAVSKAKLYLKHFQPEIVFGTGGYAAAPVFIAAQRLKIPYIVHNLDVRLGLANKFCANSAYLLTLGHRPEENFTSNTPFAVTGNPVRKTFTEIEKTNKAELYKEFNFSTEKKIIFVIGGSQGATAVNESLLEILKELILNHNVQIIHQTGEISHEGFLKRVPAKVLETTSYVVKPFFENPERCYHLSDLVISRAGAMTVSEICTMGKPAIFIPYPFAGNHQEANIKLLVESGSAVMLRQKGLKSKELLNTITELLNNQSRLNKMSATTRAFARPNAAHDIANLVLESIKNKSRPKVLV